MQNIKRTLGGKEVELVCNNSGWVTNGNSPEVIELLRQVEIKGYNSKGVPYGYDDHGLVIKLGAAELRSDSLSTHATYRPGTGGSVKDTELREKCQKGLDYLKKHPDPFLEEIFKALMPEDKTLTKAAKALESLSDEQLKALLAERGIK